MGVYRQVVGLLAEGMKFASAMKDRRREDCSRNQPTQEILVEAPIFSSADI